LSCLFIFEGIGGKFIVDGKEKRSSDESYDEEKAKHLWERSWQWCGLDEITNFEHHQLANPAST